MQKKSHQKTIQKKNLKNFTYSGEEIFPVQNSDSQLGKFFSHSEYLAISTEIFVVVTAGGQGATGVQ